MKKAVLSLVAVAVMVGGFSSAAGANPLGRDHQSDPVGDAQQVVDGLAQVRLIESVKQVVAGAANDVRYEIIRRTGMDIGPICVCLPGPPPPPIHPDEVTERAVAFVYGTLVGMDIGPICVCLPGPPPPPIHPGEAAPLPDSSVVKGLVSRTSG